MTDAQALDLVIHVSSTVIFVEAVVTIILVIRLYNRLPKPSRIPIVISGIVAVLAAIFAVSSATGIMPIVASPETISAVRALIMLLMGLPIWIILAMYDGRCLDCPIGRKIPDDHKS